MMKVILSVMLLVTMSFGWLSENYTGYGDTSVITGFKADSLKFSRIFRHGAYQNLRVDIMAADTSTAGFHADSLDFVWGLQTGHPVYNASGVLDTSWNEELMILDTLSRWDTLYSPAGIGSYIVYGTDGTFSNTRKLKDTTSVTGFIKQTSNPSIEWDVLVRGFAKGASGNDVGSFLKVWFNFVWRNKDK